LFFWACDWCREISAACIYNIFLPWLNWTGKKKLRKGRKTDIEEKEVNFSFHLPIFFDRHKTWNKYRRKSDEKGFTQYKICEASWEPF